MKFGAKQNIRIFLFTLCCSFFLGFNVAEADSDERNVVRLGISNFALPNPNVTLYNRTIDTIREVVAPQKLVVKQYSPEHLAAKAEEDKLDLVFGSSGFYRRTALETGHKELVSISSDDYPNPNFNDGSALVVRSDRKDIKTIHDLKRKVLVANAPFTFTGYIAAMGAIAAEGEDPETFFSKKIFKGEGRTMVNVARDVIDGKADVGVLRLCMLERLEENGSIPKGSLRVLNNKAESLEKCQRSTDLYPGWTVSSTPRASSGLIKKITRALLEQKPLDNGLQWGIATNYQSVDDLYKSLKLGPYSYLRKWDFQVFVNRHLWFFVGGFIAMLCLTITAVCCWLLARKRGNDLQLAMVREQKLQQEAIAANEKMNSLQKLWAVGELSAIIAHELRQPLTSINCLSRGLIRLMERDCLNEETMKDSLLHINKLALTVSRIVEKVRGYAKKPVSQKERIDVAAYAQKVLDDSSISTKGIYKITCNLEPSFVMADPVELELILANLVKNAIEASQESSVPKISFSVRNNGNSEVEIHISNNGAKLTEDQVNNLTTPFNSSKKDGLGLGLSIVRAVIESHKGHLDFNHQAEGLEVIITLPAAGEIEDGSTAD